MKLNHRPEMKASYTNITTQLLPWTLLGLICAIPVSTSIRDILLIISMICIISNPACQTSLFNLRKNKLALASMSLFIIAMLGCLWSNATFSQQFTLVSKHAKFLYFPILIVGFAQVDLRQKGLNAYLGVLFVVVCISYLKWLGIISDPNHDFGKVFYNHIMTAIMTTFAAYVAACLAWQTTGRPRLIYLLLIAIFSFEIFFINKGRTGYVTYLILMVLFLIQTLNLRHALWAVLAGTLIFIGIGYESQTMQKGVLNIVHDLKSYQQNNKDTSVGYRLQFHDYAKSLFKRNILIGSGTGSFLHGFVTDKPVPTWSHALAEPHGQYWLILAEFGLVGITIFTLFILFLIQAITKLKDMRMIATGLLAVYLAACFSDSLFFYSTMGLLFLTMMALCLSEKS